MSEIKSFVFDKYYPEKEEWDYYLQRFELEITLHGITNDVDKRNILLSKVGPETFKLLVDHFQPKKVVEIQCNEMIDTLNKHYGKKSYVLADRMQFALRTRATHESVTQYLSVLRTLAGKCDFKDTLKERLRDQLVIGLNNNVWQQEIIRHHQTNDATLEEVEATAVRLEQAELQSKRLNLLANSQANTNQLRHKHNNQHHNKHNNIQQNTQQENRGNKNNKQPNKDCIFCGNKRHRKLTECPARGQKCNACGKLNHFAKVCIKSGRAAQNNTRCVQKQPEEAETSDSSTNTSNIRHISTAKKVLLPVTLNNKKIEMLYDPGAAFSVIGKQLWLNIGSPNLTKAQNLIAYTDIEIETLGTAQINVHAFNQHKKLTVYVVAENDIPLFGLDWCLEFNITMPPGAKICHTKQNNTTEQDIEKQENKEMRQLLIQYKELFNGSMGSIHGQSVKIHIDPNATPKMFRPRPVPISLQDQVNAELKRLQAEDVLEPVDMKTTNIEWATPVVIAVKSNGNVRICGDFRVTINPHVQRDDYPLPRFEDIMSKLNGGQEFTKIDLRDAYLQINVEQESRKYLIIATHQGYFAYKRLPFGISFAPAYFQRIMDQILSGINGTICYLDDILITAPTREEHLQRVQQVLQRLYEAGIRTHVSKCEWMQDSTVFLGHRIDRYGLHPTNAHIESIRDMRTPRNTTELRSFLGSITYYSKFIPNLQIKCSPLHRLLKKNTKWIWSDQDEQIFTDLKATLTSNDTLVHYDPKQELYLTTDASDTGLGAVLFHKHHDGTLRPIAYTSRTLTEVEQRYAVIDKEALAIIYSVTKFHQYLYGRHFNLLTDHKPLERLFSEHRDTPKVASNRLLRWAMILNNYDYTISYHPGKDNAPADVLSRLPLKNTELSENEKAGLPNRGHLLNLRIKQLPITKRRLKQNTMEDKTLSKVATYVTTHWPAKEDLPAEMLHFYEKREELSVEENILLWKGRLCIPEKLQREALQMLHDGHPGICAMQSMARLHIYWHNIDKDIIEFTQQCNSCQSSRQNTTKVPLYPWYAPPEPWARIHIDFAGPFENKMFLIVIDAYTRWLEVIQVTSTTSQNTIHVLRDIFARMGIPKFIVSDNGPQLVSTEFESFCNNNGITHIRVTPYHPKSNGIAERAVKTFKERMNASDKNDELNLRLNNFLMSYRNTVQRSTGRAPSELIYGRPLRTIFDQIKPDVSRNQELETAKQKSYYDRKTKPLNLEIGSRVWVNNPISKGSTPGTVTGKNGIYSYLVEVHGQTKRKHADQLRPRNMTDEIQADAIEELPTTPTIPISPDDVEQTPNLTTTEAPTEEVEGEVPAEAKPAPPRRNPTRTRQIPERYRN